MKTTNNVQKTILKSFAVIISFVLISFTVSAQDFWKSLLQNETISEIALAMADNSAASENTSSEAEAFIATMETETEQPLEMEDWMTSESSFGTFISIETETETILQLENWMTEEHNFDGNFLYLETETEETIDLEEWMFNEDNFNSNFQTEKEKDLQLESWMTENKNWERS